MKYIEQSKFSQTIVSFRYILPFEKETITGYNLLCYMLKSKTEDFDNKQIISYEFNKNYGMKMSISLTVYGNQLSFQVQFRFIRLDWIEKKNYTESIIHIMDQFIDHPVFTEENLKESKYLLRNRLFAQKDDPATVAVLESLHMISKDHSISISTNGYEDEIDEITLEDICHLYNRFPSPLIYAAGKLDSTLETYLSQIKQTEECHADYEILMDTLSYKEKYILKEIEQTYISKVYATKIDTRDPSYYSLLVMNSILGQSPVNLLFTEIREKNSYCYSIGSSLIRFDGALYIYAGCDSENVNAILDLMDQQIVRLQTMDYSDELLEQAKKDLIDGLLAGFDEEYIYIERQFLSDLLNQNGCTEEKIKKIQNVTKEDISHCANLLSQISLAVVKEDESCTI